MEHTSDNELYVLISRSHGSLKTSLIKIDELSEPHWSTISGGYHKKSNSFSLYAYIPYKRAMELVDCSGRHNREYNEALVLIQKQTRKDPYYKGYKALLDMAPPKPPSPISQLRPEGAPPCTKKILFLLNDGPKTRGDIRSELLDIGYQGTTIRGAIYRLKAQQKIICEGPPQSKNQLISLMS